MGEGELTLHTVTETSIAEVELRLGIKLPREYCEYLLSQPQPAVSGIFTDAREVIAVNERSRKMCWLGRPLDRAFYVFGSTLDGMELFLDLDFPEPPVMAADHGKRRGILLAQTFGEWVSSS